eukprot:397278_1
MHILHKGYFILVIILAFMSSSALRKLPMPSRFNVLSESSVWTEFSSLGRETGAYNLGQGFPSWSPPKFCIDALIDATKVLWVWIRNAVFILSLWFVLRP